MKCQIEEYLIQEHFNDRQLTIEEINGIPAFETLSATDKEELSDFVFAISTVLYKIYVPESAETGE